MVFSNKQPDEPDSGTGSATHLGNSSSSFHSGIGNYSDTDSLGNSLSGSTSDFMRGEGGLRNSSQTAPARLTMYEDDRGDKFLQVILH